MNQLQARVIAGGDKLIDRQQASNALGVKIFLFLIFFVATFVVPHFLIDDHVIRGQVFAFTCGAWFWGVIIGVIYAVVTSDKEIEEHKYLMNRYNYNHGRRSKLSSTRR